MAENEDPSRYYFVGVTVGIPTRYWSALLVISSVILMAMVRTPAGFAVFGIFILGGAYGLVRPAQPNFFVEVRETTLLINVLTRIEIRYEDIGTADFYRHKKGKVVRAVTNSGVALSRLFGGDLPGIGRPGDIARDTIELKFVRVIWIYAPVPPFLIPRRSWRLRVYEADTLKEELARKLAPQA